MDGQQPPKAANTKYLREFTNGVNFPRDPTLSPTDNVVYKGNNKLTGGLDRANYSLEPASRIL